MTTDSKHNDPVAKNILGGIFNAHKSCEKWLTDITYIATQDGFLFWCIIVDLFSRRIIGWSAADHILCIGRPDFDRNFIHIRSLQITQEISGISRKCFDITALSLGKNRIESQRRLSAAAQSCNHRQFIAGDCYIYIFQIVHPCAVHIYLFCFYILRGQGI